MIGTAATASVLFPGTQVPDGLVLGVGAGSGFLAGVFAAFGDPDSPITIHGTFVDLWDGFSTSYLKASEILAAIDSDPRGQWTDTYDVNPATGQSSPVSDMANGTFPAPLSVEAAALLEQSVEEFERSLWRTMLSRNFVEAFVGIRGTPYERITPVDALKKMEEWGPSSYAGVGHYDQYGDLELWVLCRSFDFGKRVLSTMAGNRLMIDDGYGTIKNANGYAYRAEVFCDWGLKYPNSKTKPTPNPLLPGVLVTLDAAGGFASSGIALPGWTAITAVSPASNSSATALLCAQRTGGSYGCWLYTGSWTVDHGMTTALGSVKPKTDNPPLLAEGSLFVRGGNRHLYRVDPPTATTPAVLIDLSQKLGCGNVARPQAVTSQFPFVLRDDGHLLQVTWTTAGGKPLDISGQAGIGKVVALPVADSRGVLLVIDGRGDAQVLNNSGGTGWARACESPGKLTELTPVEWELVGLGVNEARFVAVDPDGHLNHVFTSPAHCVDLPPATPDSAGNSWHRGLRPVTHRYPRSSAEWR